MFNKVHKENVSLIWKKSIFLSNKQNDLLSSQYNHYHKYFVLWIWIILNSQKLK